ncbi:MAG: DUF3291 domain-containing protein [Acidimicrobiales bacterium]
MQVHLAQYNTATLRRPLDHPESASYVALLDETNARAEASPGFVWRHGIDSRDGSTQVYDNPLTLVNASVWESLTALRDYAYKGFHRDVFRRRAEWFDGSGAVMWWIPAGTIPELRECVERLEFLRRHGPTPYGFETGQKVDQLVIVVRPGDDDEVRSVTGAGVDAPSGAVHLALLDERPVGVAQLVADEMRTWVSRGVSLDWLEPALRVHARCAPGV